MLFKYVLGLWINYSTVNWERCCVMLRGCRHTAAVNPPSQRKHTCNLSDLTVADREREQRGGPGKRELVDAAYKKGDGEEWWQMMAQR